MEIDREAYQGDWEGCRAMLDAVFAAAGVESKDVFSPVTFTAERVEFDVVVRDSDGLLQHDGARLLRHRMIAWWAENRVAARNVRFVEITNV